MSAPKSLTDNQRELVAEHTGIVKWAIYKHTTVDETVVGLGYDDLFQEGCLHLCRAAASYDCEKAQFLSYAQVVVKNGLFTYCMRVRQKQKASRSIQDLLSGDLSAAAFISDDQYDSLILDAIIFILLESVKPEYNGVTRLGIEALELKPGAFRVSDGRLYRGVLVTQKRILKERRNNPNESWNDNR